MDHPLADKLDLPEAEETMPAVVENKPTEMVSSKSYDQKDDEIDEQFQDIYEMALDNFNVLSEEIQDVEGKYKARVGEVANQYLNTALSAAKEKANLKEHKDKLVVTESGGKTVNNNMIVGSYEEVIKMARDIKMSKERVIEDDEL